MKILAVYSIKGGVGKTATAVNLAWLGAQAGLRTLLWDLDPQAAATFYLRVKPRVAGGSKALFTGKRALRDAIKGSDFPGLDLLPAEFSYRHLDLLLEDAKGSTKRLRRLLKPQATAYDRVILDCPPSISVLSESVFRAAHMLIVPVIPTTLCARTLEQLADFLARQEGDRSPVLLPFFSMVGREGGGGREAGTREGGDSALERDQLERLPERFPGFLATRVPYSADVEGMGVARMPVPAYAPASAAADAYRALWLEIEGRLGVAPAGDRVPA